jgi:hypothetical protein
MSYPTDIKQTAAMESGQESPVSSGEEQHPCRFFRKGRGGRRGRCNQTGRFSFVHGFAVRFFIFSAIALTYSHRAVLAHCFEPFTEFASSWLSGPYDILKTVAAIPNQISPFFGIIFYSALAAFVMTSLRMRLMHKIQKKRAARMQRWMSQSPDGRHGHGHRHHRRHSHDQSHSATEQESQTDVEKAPLIVVDES